MKGVIGAQLFTVREHTQTIEAVAETLAKVAKIGYTAIQISAFGPVDPKAVAKLVEDNGLTVAATHVGWGDFLSNLDAVIAKHKLWKCAHPAIGGLPGEYFSQEGIQRFLEELAPIAEKLAAEGMDFSYHNHSHELGHYGGEKPWLATLYDLADPRVLKAELDTYWIQHGGGDPAAWVRRCSGRIPLLHVKDMRVAGKGEIRMAEIGEGNMNWPAILAAGQDAGVEHYLVEQDQCYDRDPFESLAISYRYLKAMGL